MNFPQTSLIPSVLALSKFLIDSFPNFSWYPYWYLGNPFQYLIGPVVPVYFLLVSKLGFTNLSLAYIVLIILSSFAALWGTYHLVRKLGVEDKQAKITALFNLIAPFSFGLLIFGNGLHQIAFNLTPLVLIIFLHSLTRKNFKWDLILVLSIAFELLIDVSIILPLIIGLASILIVQKNLSFKYNYIILKLILILFLSIVLATLWYQTNFWWTLFTNPSFGGIPLINLLHFMFNLILNLLPLVLAIVFIRFQKKSLEKNFKFGLVFLGSFVVLTLIRFVSDPDFVIDWISYLTEIQFGASFLVGFYLTRKNNLLYPVYLVSGILILINSFIFMYIMQGGNINYEQKIYSIVSRHISPEERVFLSGSPVFWINSRLDVQQIRGGNDSASVNPSWAKAAYQIREGNNLDLTSIWSQNLGASDILVHNQSSLDYFHDFKKIDKFKSLRQIAGDEDDLLLKNENSSIARVAKSELLTIAKPKNGADLDTLTQYSKTLKENIKFKFIKPDLVNIEGDFAKGELISLAISFHPNWRVLNNNAKIVSDSLGNIVLIPKDTGYQIFTLKFSNPFSEKLFLGVISLLILISLYFFDYIYPYFLKLTNQLSFGIDLDDEE